MMMMIFYTAQRFGYYCYGEFVVELYICMSDLKSVSFVTIGNF